MIKYFPILIILTEQFCRFEISCFFTDQRKEFLESFIGLYLIWSPNPIVDKNSL